MKTGLISIKNLTKEFRQGNTPVVALDSVSLELKMGRIIALRGPSGCGKSTLLNLVGILDHPTSGSITVEGTNISVLTGKSEVAFRRDRIGFIFQSFNLVPYLSAVENVMLPMEFTSLSASERKKRAKELLSQVGIDNNRQEHRPSRLSGGQQQRVAVARAIANTPDILLADEPTANLDSDSGEQVLKILSELSKQGKTIIVATHSSEIASFADTIVNIKDGKVVE